MILILLLLSFLSLSYGQEHNSVFICHDNQGEIEVEFSSTNSATHAYFAGKNWIRIDVVALKEVASDKNYIFRFSDKDGGYLKVKYEKKWTSYIKETKLSNERYYGECVETY